MRSRRSFGLAVFVVALLTGAIGCASPDTASAVAPADQLQTFVGDFLRQALAAFLL